LEAAEQLPETLDPESLRKYFTLTETDLQEVAVCRGVVNKLGFAVQLCTLRWQGYFLGDTRGLPTTVLETLARQLGLLAMSIDDYPQNEKTRWVLCFGKEGALRGREFGDQLHTFSCLSVLHNAVVAWNMVHIEPVLELLRAEGQRCDDELLSLTTPLLRRHLNPFGRYYFDLVRMRQDGGQLVELPSEPSASERVGP
jgi:hypothetical protein